MKTILTFYFIIFTLSINLTKGQEVETKQDSNQNSFEEFTKKAKLDFQIASQQNISSYQKFSLAKKKAFESFKRDIKKKWGKNNFIVSDRVNWVEYSDDKNVRSRVDFKDGEAGIEVLISEKDAENKKVIDEKILNAVKTLLKNKGTTIDYTVEKIKPEPLLEKPVLLGLVESKEGAILNESNIEIIAKEIVRENRIETKTVNSAEGEKIELILNFPLSKNYLLTRFNQVKPYIESFAKKYDIEPALIVAIIHVESYFNPKAVSSAHAIGLMQLVPSSGGIEAYTYVYGKNKEPTYNELINPNINTELGTAYLHILMTRYFSNIKNYDNKRFCTIASYNTGVGNVSLTLTGTKSYTKACKKANEYSQPIELYKYLTNNLKYEEARKYLKKVNDRYLDYKAMILTK